MCRIAFSIRLCYALHECTVLSLASRLWRLRSLSLREALRGGIRLDGDYRPIRIHAEVGQVGADRRSPRGVLRGSRSALAPPTSATAGDPFRAALACVWRVKNTRGPDGVGGPRMAAPEVPRRCPGGAPQDSSSSPACGRKVNKSCA
ncbi:hypothetical protein KM043_003846 [Ampulex compressa]|nr:hypothetical protein KM043_003846 [Ampulex compressa]